MIKNNIICDIFWHKFNRYEKIKEDEYLEYWESYCYRCNKKDIYITNIYY